MKRNSLIAIITLCFILAGIPYGWAVDKKLSDITIGITGFNFGC